ncbi:transposase [Streptomyces sp. bgisy031]|uniref:transposase n=1 Tax=Streptomyces sp. bgisy031 TaxID=3413772 RepID=UPI003D722BEA
MTTSRRDRSRHRPLPRRLTTKIHLAADGRCRPLAFVLTPEQAGNAPASTDAMARLRVPRHSGQPHPRPDLVPADKTYSSREIRDRLRRRGIRAVIPERADQRTNWMRRGRAGDRTPAFDREGCEQRNTVERYITQLKQWRGIATHYEKTATLLPGRDSTSQACICLRSTR